MTNGYTIVAEQADMAGRLMIGLLPVFLVALTLVAVNLHHRATRLYGNVGCPHQRPNHSLSAHPAARWGQGPGKVVT